MSPKTTLPPTRVLKADAVRSLGSKIVFNYDELQQECQKQVEALQEQSRMILAAAKAEADEIRKRAIEDAAAITRSKRADPVGKSQECQSPLPAACDAAQTLLSERDRWLLHWEQTAIRLSVAIAEKLIRRQLTVQPEIAAEMIREALELAAGSPQITVRVHPQDAELFGMSVEQLMGGIGAWGQAILVRDESITQGGCLIETLHGSVDARLECRLDRIAAELLHA